MPSPLSVDLSERVVAAVSEGASFHRAAARFGVSVSSASCWSRRLAQLGLVASKPTHGNDSLPAIEAHAERGQVRQPHPPSIIALMRAASVSITKGLVITAMPGSRCPLPTAAFSA